MMTDPIADMLTRIRNAVRIESPIVDIPASRMKVAIAEVLKKEGYIYDYQVGRIRYDEQGLPQLDPVRQPYPPQTTLRIILKYGDNGEKVIQHIERVSKPGCRIYRNHKELEPVLDGLGIAIVSTSRGVMSDREAKRRRLGGEVLCRVW
ncbi:MAG: 30S ribosomal protein S8 [Gemmataceae bacterium]